MTYMTHESNELAYPRHRLTSLRNGRRELAHVECDHCSWPIREHVISGKGRALRLGCP
jgi:hypothetical protein